MCSFFFSGSFRAFAYIAVVISSQSIMPDLAPDNEGNFSDPNTIHCSSQSQHMELCRPCLCAPQLSSRREIINPEGPCGTTSPSPQLTVAATRMQRGFIAVVGSARVLQLQRFLSSAMVSPRKIPVFISTGGHKIPRVATGSSNNLQR